jgi:hypothetical protein
MTAYRSESPSGINKATKRSANEFELDNQELTGSAPEPKRLQTEHSFEGNRVAKRSTDDFELDNPERAISTSEPKRLRTEHSHKGRPGLTSTNMEDDELDHADPKTGTQPSARSAFPVPNPQVQQPRTQIRRSLNDIPPAQGVAEETGGNVSASSNAWVEDGQDMGAFGGKIQRVTELKCTQLQNLFKSEVRKQRALICGPPDSLSREECDRRMLDIWVRQAQEWETSNMAAENIKEEGIPAAKTTVLDVMTRQNAILKVRIHRWYPVPNEKENYEGYWKYRCIAEANVLYCQLNILRGWTEKWMKELSGQGVDRIEADPVSGEAEDPKNQPPATLANSENGPKPLQGRRGEPSQSAHETPNLGRQLLGSAHTSPVKDRGQVHQPLLSNSFRERSRSESRQSVPLNGSDGSRVQYTNDEQLYLLEDSQCGYGYSAQVQSQQQPVGHGQGQNEFVQSALYQSIGPSNPGAVSRRKYQSSNLRLLPSVGTPAQHIVAADNLRRTISTANPQIAAPPALPQGRRKRGAPRKRMFPNAPGTDTPLSTTALTSEDEVLKHFPEHLALKEVMQRFVKSSSTHPGGYATKEMVKELLKHAISHDSDQVTGKEREQKVHRWVIKEKDACNKLLKAGQAPSSPSVSTTPTTTTAPTRVQSPASTVATSVTPHSLQAPLSTTAPYGPQSAPQGPQRMAAPSIEPAYVESLTVSHLGTAAPNFETSGHGYFEPQPSHATSLPPSNADSHVDYPVDPELLNLNSEQDARISRGRVIGGARTEQCAATDDWSLPELPNTIPADIFLLRADHDGDSNTDW